MFFMPVLVAFAAEEGEERHENYERRPAFCAEPIHRHLRLTDEQFDAVSEEYHDWRIRQTGINRGLSCCTWHLVDTTDRLDLHKELRLK
jgi:hypothetical protein